MSNIREKYTRSLEDFYAANLFVMQGKSSDYAEVSDPFSNFRFAALSAGITIEQVLLVLLGIKLARLKNLIVGNNTPNNESVSDTLGDDANYAAILNAYLELKNTPDPSYAFSDVTEDNDEDDEEEVTPEPQPPAPGPAERLLEFFSSKFHAKPTE